ncbi:MAG: diphthine--ammonia ligase [Candidatus Omnitrophica bacterium]|nr:diphthine--ammonia ligase [Candidatus Omnitrophota bacterium]
MKQGRTACFWSSGKDSCISLYKALAAGEEISYLLNFISQEYRRVSFHGAQAEIVRGQADSIGIPLLQRETTMDNYEAVFLQAMEELKEMGVSSIVRGDIYLQDLRDWVEEKCASRGMKVISPIWHLPAEKLIHEFVDCGFKAVITSADAAKLDRSFTGRAIDKSCIADLKAIAGVDICGEKGEYHSFVFDGPIFKRYIEILESETILMKGYWFLNIKRYAIRAKGGENED